MCKVRNTNANTVHIHDRNKHNQMLPEQKSFCFVNYTKVNGNTCKRCACHHQIGDVVRHEPGK